MSLVIWYDLKSDTTDKSGYNNNPIYSNVIFSDFQTIKISKFNGIDNYVQLPNNQYTTTSGPYDNITISFFFMTYDIQKKQMLYKCGHDLYNLGIFIFNNYIYVVGYNKLSNWIFTKISGRIISNKWHNIVLKIVNGNKLYVYLDKVLLGIDSITTFPNNNANIFIGKNDGFRFDDNIVDILPYFYDGYLVDFRYYNLAVSDEFINDYYDSFLPTTHILEPFHIQSIEQHTLRIHNTSDDNNFQTIYITRQINQLMNMVGSDIVLKGLHVINYEIINNKLMISLCPGIVIQDLSLIDILENINLSIDVNNYGYYIIHTEYKVLESNEVNPFKIFIQYLDNNIYWDKKKTKILLGILYFDGNKLELVNDNIVIDNTFYYIRGINRFNMIDNIFNFNRHNTIFPISEGDFINTETNSYINANSMVLLSQNGNLILNKSSPYYNPNFILHTPFFEDKNTKLKYNIFCDDGNIILILNKIDLEQNNPNLKDIGTSFSFLQQEFQLNKNENSLSLDTPNAKYNLCNSDLYEYEKINYDIIEKTGPGSNYGFFCGGYSSINYSFINRFLFNLDSQIETVANLSASKINCCSNNSTNYGFVCGGMTKFYNSNSVVNNVDRFIFNLTVGNSINVNTLDDRIFSAANNSSYYGYICGGETKDNVQKFLFPFLSSSVESVDLSRILSHIGSQNCSLYGYVSGSENTTSNGLINRFLFSLPSHSIIDMYTTTDENIFNNSGNNSSQYGYIIGPSNISKFLFTTNGISVENDLNISFTSANNSTQYGYICGGLINHSIINYISKFNFQTSGLQTEYLYLSEFRYSGTALDGVDFASMFI